MKHLIKFHEIHVNPTYEASIALLILGVVNYLLQYVLTTYLTHHMSARVYGDFNLSVSVLSVLGGIVLLGTQTTAVKYLPGYISSNAEATVEDFLRWTFRLVRVSFLICFVIAVLALVGMLYSTVLGKELNSYHLCMFMLWVAPFAAFALLVQNYILSNNHPVVSYLLQNDFSYLFQLVLFFLAISVIGMRIDNVHITLVLILAYLVLILITAFALDRENKDLFKSLVDSFSTAPKNIHPEWWVTSRRAIPSSLVYMINGVIDLIVLKIVSPDKAQVGLYSVAWLICYVIILIPQSIFTIVLPKINLYTDKNSKLPLSEFQAYLNKIALLIWAITIPVTALIIIFAKYLLAMFGPEYLSAVPVLIICACTSVFFIVATATNNLLTYSGHIPTTFYLNLTQLLILAILGAVLTHFYNIIGISVTYLISELVIAIASLYLVRSRLHVRSMLIV